MKFTSARRSSLFSAVALLSALALPAQAKLDQAAVDKVVQKLDADSARGGDWKAVVTLAHEEKGKPASLREAVVYNREDGANMVMLFAKPKTEQGKGYLLMESNIWYYDPSVGKWERRTESDRIAGTGSRRSDFDASQYSVKYNASYDGEQTLGKKKAHRLVLKVKDGVEVAYPMLKLFVDTTSGLLLQSEEYALSGKLLRTTYYQDWKQVLSESKKGPVWFPTELRLFSDVEQSKTVVKVQAVDTKEHPQNLFTKAWLESKSR